MATCIYNHERWSVLDRNENGQVLIWRPTRKERWVDAEAIDVVPAAGTTKKTTTNNK